MFTKAVGIKIYEDIAGLDLADAGQQWILSAMQKHGPSLINMLWRILGNEQDVCDAYQDTFLQLAHLEFGRKPDNIPAYLFRTSSNIAVSILRRRKCHQKYLREAAYELEPVHQPAKQPYELDVQYLLESLRSKLLRLPEQLRSVLVLRDLAELSYDQVAKTLGISTKTARVYHSRAIQVLAVWMAKEED